MNKKFTYFLILGCLVFSAIFVTRCTKENFIEPADPFEPERLEPNPYQLYLGSGANKIPIKTNNKNITETSDGLRIKGGLFAENELYGDILISSGDFELIKNPNDEGYSDITGFALVDLPKEGLLHNLINTGISAAPLGFKKGSEFEIAPFGWPVNENRYYFYYELETPFDVSITNSAIENIKKIAVDPLDPYFFISCDFSGTPLGDLSDVGLAISSQGFIEYQPHIDYYNKIKSFNANIFLSAALTLSKYPVTIHGETYIGFNPDDSSASDNFFAGEVSSYKQGFNGNVTLDHAALDWLNLEMELGGASALLEIDQGGDTKFAWASKRTTETNEMMSGFLVDMLGDKWAKFSGYLSPYKTEVLFWGSIGNELDDFEMGFRNSNYLKIGGYTLDMGTIQLYVSPERLSFYGSTYMVMFGNVGVVGDVDFEDGSFEFKGFMSRHKSYNKYGLKLGIDFDLYLKVKSTSSTKLTLEGEIDLEAEICLGKICIDFETELYVSINTDGEFTIKFKIGICSKGFSVTLKYRRGLMANAKHDIEIYEVEEVSYDEIPMQYRFAEDVSYEEAMSEEIEIETK